MLSNLRDMADESLEPTESRVAASNLANALDAVIAEPAGNLR